jgi:hypothetical protein
MTDAGHEDRGLDDLGTPADIRAPRDPQPTEPVDPSIADPHGATDPISRDEYVGRRGGLVGVWDSIAYWVQYALLSTYGTADQSEEADPVQRLKRKYGRPESRY